jgi:hypothetical protein
MNDVFHRFLEHAQEIFHDAKSNGDARQASEQFLSKQLEKCLLQARRISSKNPNLPVLRTQAGLWLSNTHPDDRQQPEAHSNVIRYVGAAHDVTEQKTFDEVNKLMP